MLPKNAPYFIAETALYHQGDIGFLRRLVGDLATSPINAIKFHLLFDIDDYFVSTHPAREVVRKIIIPQSEWAKIFEIPTKNNKDIILLTNDVKSLKWVNSIQDRYPIEAIELHSTGLNDVFLLKECLDFKKTIILGVGGSSLDEIQYAVDFLKQNNKYDILLMHGFQNYPTDYKDINLKRMNLLSELFSLPIGYADHTDPLDPKNTLISVLPQTLGYNILEKHVTNVFGEKRIDAQAAVSLEAMAEIMDSAKAAYLSMGDDCFRLSEAEKNYGNTGPMKKAIVAKERIHIGEIVGLDKIAFKRTEVSSPLTQIDVIKLMNSVAKKEIAKDELLSFDNIEYEFKKGSLGQFFVSIK